MRHLLAFFGLAAAALVAVPSPAQADDVSVHARIGIGDVRLGIDAGDRRHGFRDGGRRDGFHRRRFVNRGSRSSEPMDFGGGPVNLFAFDQQRAEQERGPIRHGRRQGRGNVYIPYGHYLDGGYDSYDDDEEDYRDGFREGYRQGFGDGFEEEAAEPPEPPTAVLEPPEARGPKWISVGAQQAGPEPSYALGAPLPEGRPHVALDWEDYGFPAPPAGQAYVRFDGAVLLIETGTRIVRGIFQPTG